MRSHFIDVVCRITLPPVRLNKQLQE